MKENVNTNHNIEFKKTPRYIYKRANQILVKQIDDIKTVTDNKKSAMSWQIVNKITGRKTTNISKIKAKDDKKRIQKWK